MMAIIKWLIGFMPIQVWTISHEDYGKGYTVDKSGLDDIAEELIADFDGCSHIDDIRRIVNQFMRRVEFLEIGWSLKFNKWKVRSEWTTRRAINKLPEFQGW
jgi:hypothetical protein